MLEANFTAALEQVGLMLARAANPLPAITRIGASEAENVKARIKSSKRTPWGNNWAPWAPSTAKERQRKGNTDLGLLFDEGDLYNSIRAVANVYGPGHATLDIGSDLSYAGFLQDGTEKMAARQYLGWNPAVFPFYELMLDGFIEFGNETAHL
jgi:hypothetical protein